MKKSIVIKYCQYHDVYVWNLKKKTIFMSCQIIMREGKKKTCRILKWKTINFWKWTNCFAFEVPLYSFEWFQSLIGTEKFLLINAGHLFLVEKVDANWTVLFQWPIWLIRLPWQVLNFLFLSNFKKKNCHMPWQSYGWNF